LFTPDVEVEGGDSGVVFVQGAADVAGGPGPRQELFVTADQVAVVERDDGQSEIVRPRLIDVTAKKGMQRR
jgi:hypothetical protein